MNMHSTSSWQNRAILVPASVDIARTPKAFTASTATDAEPVPVPEKPGIGTTEVTTADVQASAVLTRSEVLTRARSWVDVNVKYTQYNHYANQYGDYRMDCSGFVSMAWGLTPTGMASPTTVSLPSYGIWLNSLDDLKPGDAIDDPGSHVVLFVSWTDSSHSVANVYEETSYTDESGPNPGAIASRYSRSTLINRGYKPLRYRNIVDGVASPSGPATQMIKYGDELHVFATGVDKRVHQQVWRPSSGWSGWSDLDGQVVGSPMPIVYGTQISVFVTGVDGHVHERTWYPASGWTGWNDHGGQVVGDLQPLQYGDELHVFATGVDKRVHQQVWRPSSGWSGWSDLDGQAVGRPMPIAYGTQISVFVTGIDARLHEKDWNPASDWTGWFDHGGSLAS